MASDKSLRDDVAELAEAVRELRDREVADTLRDLRAEVAQLRAERTAHHCHGCSCTHFHWQPYTWTLPGTVTHPNYTVTSGTSTAAGTATTVSLTGLYNN
jgi:hypothetical protein